MNIGMVSEHASPLAVIGGVDAGGQNVHVAELSAALVALGHRVVVYTRRDDPSLPRYVEMPSGVIVAHVDAGPAAVLPKDELFGHMHAFAEDLYGLLLRDRIDLVHAHFWMSGYASIIAGRRAHLPVVQTFHALGTEKRRFQGIADTSPGARIAVETEILRNADFIVATSSAEIFELSRLGADAHRMKVIPCGVDVGFFDAAREPFPIPRSATHRIVCLSRLVERKGIADVIAALRALPDTELLVGGGGEATDLHDDSEARRLLQIAREEGIEQRVTLVGRLRRDQVPAFL